MATPFAVRVVTPEKILFDGEAEMVFMRASNGDIAFLAHHMPFIGSLEIGLVKIKTSEKEILVALHGGFVKVKSSNLDIVAGVAELGEQIDIDRARTALDRANSSNNPDDLEVQLAQRRASVRLQAAGVSP